MFVLAFPTPALPGSGSKGRPRKDSQPYGSPSYVDTQYSRKCAQVKRFPSPEYTPPGRLTIPGIFDRGRHREYSIGHQHLYQRDRQYDHVRPRSRSVGIDAAAKTLHVDCTGDMTVYAIDVTGDTNTVIATGAGGGMHMVVVP